ncbi:TetR/AcrR family transcriptional regulator [Streptomyces collinus]
MGRHKQPEIRDRILDACVDHALRHGLPDRLEPLAAASGTSARMLIYHFGTRDALLREPCGGHGDASATSSANWSRLGPTSPIRARCDALGGS